MITFQQVLNASKIIHTAWQNWVESGQPRRMWNRREVQIISEELDLTIREQTDLVADAGQSVEPKARGLLLCLDDVAQAHLKWLQDGSLGLPTAPPWGSDQWTRVLDRLGAQLSVKRLPLPSPIAHLQAAGVSPNQIAITYGWKDESGAPDTEKVFEEIAKPGTHYDPKKWVHPAEKSIVREIDSRWEKRTPRSKLFDYGPPAETLEKPPVPTLDELIKLKAPVAQIMRLHNMDEEDVLQAAESAGIDLNEREIKPANAKVAHHERMKKQKV